VQSSIGQKNRGGKDAASFAPSNPGLSVRFSAARTAALLAADPEIDRLLQSPVGKDWVTNGGNLTNQRYSTLNRSTQATSSSSKAPG